MRRALLLVLVGALLAGVVQLATMVAPREPRAIVHASNARESRLAWGRQLQRLLRAGAFDHLERIAEECRTTEARWPSGDWKLRTFYEAGFHAPLFGDDETAWERHLIQLQAWARTHPRSITAPVALAEALTGYAWKARERGHDATVKSEGWEPFRERLDRASAVLEHAARLPRRCPGWYQVMQSVALGVGWPEARYQALLGEALRLHPDYPAYYELAAQRLLPRWSGVPGDWERFALAATDTLPEPLQSELYARIVWHQSRHYRNVFDQSEASWPRVRRGFRLMSAAYPGSIELESARLTLAEQAGDAEETAIAARWLGNRRDIGAGSMSFNLRRGVERFLKRS